MSLTIAQNNDIVDKTILFDTSDYLEFICLIPASDSEKSYILV